LRKAVEILDGRHPQFAREAMKECASAKVLEYVATVEKLQPLSTDLGGLAQVAYGFHARHAALRQIDIRVPDFGGTTPSIAIGEYALAQAAAPWRSMERELIADPLANLDSSITIGDTQ
jgi:hypothetical protein